MTKPIDVLQMAHDAGFLVGPGGAGVPQRFLTDGPVDAPWLEDALKKFSEIVLERAAMECDDRLSHWKMVRDLGKGCAAHDCALSIRALKPVLEKNNT